MNTLFGSPNSTVVPDSTIPCSFTKEKTLHQLKAELQQMLENNQHELITETLECIKDNDELLLLLKK